MEAHRRIENSDLNRAKLVCGQFLCGEWIDPNQIKVTVLTGGLVNFVLKCQLTDKDESEFNPVIVRLITGYNPFRCLGEAGEALAMKAIANAGIGPELIGAFDGGRLEQFIDCRMLTNYEARTLDVLIALAKHLARQHSLSIEIRKDPNIYKNCIRDYVLDVVPKFKTSQTFKNLEQFEPEIRTSLEVLLNRDYLSEFDWIFDQLWKVPNRVVCFSHGDHYLNNVLVRSTWRSELPINEFDIISVDVEMGSYFYRGLDVGLLINELGYDYSNTGCPKRLGPLNFELEKQFIGSYLETWKKLNPDKVDQSLDTIENVLIESRLLALVYGIYGPVYVLNEMSRDSKKIEAEPLSFHVKHYQDDLIKKAWIQNQLK